MSVRESLKFSRYNAAAAGIVAILAVAISSPAPADPPPPAPAKASGPAKGPAAGNPALSRMARADLYRVHRRAVAAKGAPPGGGAKRGGTMQVQVSKYRAAHDFDGDVTTSADGASGSLLLNDTTDGASVTFAVDNERSEISVTIDSAKTTVKNNPDGSLSIDGTVFTDRRAAAKAFVKRPAMRKLTPEAWAAADAYHNDTPVSAKAGDIVGAACDIFCDAVVNELLGAVGCNWKDGPVWEWTC